MTQKPATAPQMNRRIVMGTGTAAMGAVLLGRPGPALAQAKMDHPNPMPGELRAVLERNPALPVLGNPKGDVTLTEFFDYNCPYCRTNMADIQRLIAEDPKLRVVFREWPVFGEGSVFAARAALASRKQDRYADFHRALMSQKPRAERASVLRVARSMGLDTQQLQRDMNGPEIAQHIQQSNTLAEAMGLVGTPTFIAGSDSRFGAISSSELAELVAASRRN